LRARSYGETRTSQDNRHPRPGENRRRRRGRASRSRAV